MDEDELISLAVGTVIGLLAAKLLHSVCRVPQFTVKIMITQQPLETGFSYPIIFDVQQDGNDLSGANVTGFNLQCSDPSCSVQTNPDGSANLNVTAANPPISEVTITGTVTWLMPDGTTSVTTQENQTVTLKAPTNTVLLEFGPGVPITGTSISTGSSSPAPTTAHGNGVTPSADGASVPTVPTASSSTGAVKNPLAGDPPSPTG